MKIRIVSVGKTKEKWLAEALDDYLLRLKPIVVIDFIHLKSNEQLAKQLEKESYAICLDSNGKMMTSEDFALFLAREMETQGARLTFIIGGAEGLPLQIKERFPAISLSTLTFTHQLARLILIEQLYRAFEILKGSKYHK